MTKKFKIGIDYGGTKIEGILLNENGEQIERKRYSYDRNYESGIDTIKKLVNEFDKISGESCTVGIGIPGFSSKETGLITNANSLWLNDKPFNKDLEKKLNRTVKLMNDANCFTLSEAVDGAGKNFNVVFGVIIGTGTGGGIVVNKKILKGKNNIGGEWGHIQLPNRSDDEKKFNKKCYCGLDGCMETYVSGPGFAYNYNLKNNSKIDSHEIIKNFKDNDKKAIIALNAYINHLARGLAIVSNILDPDIIVLGGGMSNIDFIYRAINKEIKKYIFSDTFITKVVKNFHGDSGGVRGAAWLG